MKIHTSELKSIQYGNSSLAIKSNPYLVCVRACVHACELIGYMPISALKCKHLYLKYINIYR